MDFPLLQNMFIKGEKIGGPKITEDEYKKQILNQGTSDATDIIMSFNVNFEESKVATKTQSTTSGLPGVQLFVSQLVNYVYSSVIGVYFGNPASKQYKDDPTHIPGFFNNSNYEYIDDTGAVESRISTELNKLILNKCNFIITDVNCYYPTTREIDRFSDVNKHIIGKNVGHYAPEDYYFKYEK